MADPIMSFDEALAAEDSKLPTWDQAVQEHDPENYNYFQAAGNVVKNMGTRSAEGGRSEALTDAQRIFAEKQPFWNTVKAFGLGYAEDNISATKDSPFGLPPLAGYADQAFPMTSALVDGYAIPAAKRLWSTAVTAPYAGVTEAAKQLGTELVSEQFGRDLAVLPEAFPVESVLGFQRILPREIARAKANRVLEDESTWLGMKEPDPISATAIDDAAVLANTDHIAAAAEKAQTMRNNIMADVKKDLLAVGRPAEEAEAASQLVASYYETRAARFNGVRGNAEELYATTSPEIKAGRERAGKNAGVREFAQEGTELNQKARGKIRLATDKALAQITLFKSANASTFIHETGHGWLDDLIKDSAHESANAAIKADADIVHNWLGVKAGDVIPTKAHEKFARGFERYMMEGVAPSEGLARVFSQFKTWLTDIYKTVLNLKSPVNDEIRGVFDRMLALDPKKTVIVPETPAGKMMADIHEADAATAVSGDVSAVRKTIEGEVDQIAQKSPEVEDALRSSAISGGEQVGGAANIAAKSSDTPTPIIGVEKLVDELDTVPEGGAEAGGNGGRIIPAETLRTPKSDLVDKAGNIRLDNLTDTEDVKQVMRDMAAQENEFMGARRGVVSDAMVSDLADAMGIDAKKLNIDKLRDISVNDDIPLAARIKVGRRMLVQSAEAARDAMQKVVDSKGADEALLALADARRNHLMISETIAGVTAEWGRAGRAFRDISKEDMAQSEAVTDLFQKMTGMSMEEMRAMAKNPEAFDTAAKAAKLLQDSAKPGWGKKILEYRLAAMLSSPTTHVKNVVSNYMMAVQASAETALASGVGKVLGSADRVYLGEAKERLFAIQRGSVEGWQSAKAILQDENAVTGNRTIENVHTHAIGGKGGEIIRIPFRLLSASDEISKAVAFRQEINALAYRKATSEGLKGDAWNNRMADLIQNPTDEMMDAAKVNADYQTLTSSLTGMPKKAQDVINSNWLLKNIIPFFRTNVNSLKYFVKERTPIGVLFEDIRDNLAGKNGTVSRDTQIARMALGTSISVLTSTLVNQGLMTGGGPPDASEQAMMRMTGWQPYSVKIGDSYYSYEPLQGFSTSIGMAADVADVIKRGIDNDEETEKIVVSASAVLSKRLLEISSLQGLSDTVKALDNPEGFGSRWVANYIGSYVPGFMGSIARANDPEVREMRDGILAPAQSRVPFLRNELMAKRDVWGNEIKNQGTLGPDVISPIFQSQINKDPVNKRLIALGYFPARADKKIRGVELNPKQYDDYVRISGRTMKMRLNVLIAQPGFEKLPESIQIKAAKKIVDQSREQARKLIMMENPDIVRQAVENKRAELAK